jgi:hypothetical protein
MFRDRARLRVSDFWSGQDGFTGSVKEYFWMPRVLR